MPCSNCKFAREYELYPEVEIETVMEAPFLFGKPRQVEIIKPGSYWAKHLSLEVWTLDEVKELCYGRNNRLKDQRACCLNPKSVKVSATYECSHYQQERKANVAVTPN